jgi:phosphoesterase RecJ-like protein
MLTEVLRAIDGRTSFLVTSHARPDGDAVGSALACSQILQQMGKQTEIVLRDPVPVIYRPLPFSETVIHEPAVNGQHEAAIVLECDSVQRTHLSGLDGQFLINIDHHASGRAFAQINWIDPNACATAEMIYRLALAANVVITPQIATCLYTAVLTDTGSFSYAGTNERTFALAEELVHCGANPVEIAHAVYFSNPASKMRLLGAALRNLHREADVAWMFCTQQEIRETEALEEDAEGLVNYALAITGVEVAAFFRELSDGRFRVSLRSKGKLNVATIAARFGGGGHVCASGFAVPGPLDSAVKLVVDILRGSISSAN